MSAVVVGLWSVILEPGKTHSQNVSPGIQITNISFGAEVAGDARTVVSVKYPEFEQDSDDEDDEEESDEEGEDGDIKLPKLITKEAVIAILKPNVTEQVSVNITLVEDVEVVEFSITGPNAVHLVGHYVRQEDFDQDPYSDSEGYDSNDESIDSDLEEGMSGMIGEDSDEERFEEVKETKKTAPPSDVPPLSSLPPNPFLHTVTVPPHASSSLADLSNPKKRAAEEDDDVAASLLAKSAAGADDSMSSTLSKNQKKKLAKKQKVEPEVAEKKVEKTEVVKEAAAAPAAPAAKKAPVPQTLAGGLVILDSKKGDGPVAKSGKKVGMRYIGKLDNGKVFDSNTKGSPLNFTLGRGEVIKGWDMGVAGMAVGGERKLTIPAALAYGKKGTQGIPGNATLHFDVKLVSLK